MLETIYDIVPFASEQGMGVIVGCEDASRADAGFMKQVAEAAREPGGLNHEHHPLTVVACGFPKVSAQLPLDSLGASHKFTV